MSRFFINRPIVAMVISILMVIIGLVAMSGLPIAQFPNIVPPEIQVKTTYTGADALTVEQSVATPIEQQMSGVDNMNYMYSTNANDGSMTLNVNFDVKTDTNIDQMLTQMRQGQASSQLPADVRSYGVTVQKSTSSPLIMFALYSPKGTYDSIFLANYSYININDQMTRINGIASVTVFGAGQYAMRFWVDPDRLAKLNITIPEIINAINAQNKVNPAGQVGAEPVPKGQEFTYAVRAQGRLQTEEEFGRIVVRANPDGSIVRVKDVARIELGAQTYNLNGRLNGKPAALVALYQMPGSNALDAADGAKKLMAELKARFPDDLDYVVCLDTTLAVTEGMKEIVQTLFEALVLVIIVVFIFLQGWRATLIPLLAVPVSLVGTFALFPLFGFSINTLSLFGLVLAIGLVVDDAIVVVEAVEHHIEQGMAPKDAALKAMEEVSGPVIAIAIILSAVFIPTAFIPGITGRLYQQFAVTIAISVIISAFNALILEPGAGGDAAETEGEGNRAPAEILRRVQPGLRPGHEGIRQRLRPGDPQKRAQPALPGGRGGDGGTLRQVDRHQLPPRGGPGVPLRRDPAPRRLLAAAHRRGRQEGRGGHPEDAGGEVLLHRRRLQPAQRRATTPTAPSSSSPWKSGRSGRSPRSSTTPSRPTSTGGSARSPTPSASPSRRRPSPASAPPAASRSSSRTAPARTSPFLAANTAKFIEAARKRPELSAVSTTFRPTVPQLFVDVDRDKVLKQGVNLTDVYKTLQSLHGERLRELLQPVRPPVAGVRPGGGGLPHQAREHRPVLRAQQRRGNGPPVGAHLVPQHRRAGVHHALQPLPVRPDQRLRRPRLQFGPGHEGPGGGLRPDHAARDGLRLSAACPSRRRRPRRGFPRRSSSASPCSASS